VTHRHDSIAVLLQVNIRHHVDYCGI
jgi:hypothetical protein